VRGARVPAHALRGASPRGVSRRRRRRALEGRQAGRRAVGYLGGSYWTSKFSS
jgi:hypothetical protein